jgi:hypothetical protein
MQNGPELDMNAQIARFASGFYGFEPDATWIGACRDVFELSPMRGEWLGLIKNDPTKLPPRDQLSHLAHRWSEIATAVRDAAPRVQRQARAYEVFELLVRILAHFYRKAERLQAGGPNMVERWRQWLEIESGLTRQVDAIWDQERFSDDPKKYVPDREHFRDNHLVILLQYSLEQTRQHCDAAN